MNELTPQANSTDKTLPPNPPAPPAPLPPILCWVGLDWADKKHFLAVRTSPSERAKTHEVEQKPQKLDEFFLNLRRQHLEGRIAVAIEQSRGPVLYALMKYDFLVLYPVNPRTLADYRRAFKVSGAKDDPLDADLLCELVCCHADRLRPLAIEDETTRQLRLLTEARRGFVDERTALSNHLGAVLKCYYPLAMELVGEDLAGPLALALLRRWPNLQSLQAAKPGVVRAFFYAQNSRSEDKIVSRLEALKQARPLTQDPALLEPLQLQMQRLVAHLSTVHQTIKCYDQRLKEVFATHSHAQLFEALPGAGPVLAARLAALFGTKKANFPEALDLLCFTGVAPVRKQSGAQQVVQFRYARPIFLHQSVVEFAKCSIGRCGWAGLLFEHELKEGKSTWMAIRKVAFKWLRILWRCWTDGKPYDETQYLRSLQRDGVQLYRSLYEGLAPLQKTIVNNSQKTH
jgi:transposase